MQDKPCFVYVTADRQEDTDKIEEALLNEKLAACVSVIQGVQSSYWWNGTIEKAEEKLMMIATKEALVPEITQRVNELHSYEVPEVACVEIKNGNPNYIKWIMENTK